MFFSFSFFLFLPSGKPTLEPHLWVNWQIHSLNLKCSDFFFFFFGIVLAADRLVKFYDYVINFRLEHDMN